MQFLKRTRYSCNLWVAAAGIILAIAAQASEDKRLILPGQKPDLEISSFSHKGVFTVGNSVTFYWGVRNASLVDTSSTWTDCIYISDSKFFSTDETQLYCGATRATLDAKEGYSRKATVTLPQIPAGTYYLWVATDTGGQVSEVSETNNYQKYGPIAVAASGIPPRVLPEINLLHVSALGGSDQTGLGTSTSPLSGLSSALDHAASYATPESPVCVRISAGFYTSPILLPANVELLGANPLDPGETIIRPVLGNQQTEGAGILIADGEAVLRDVTIQIDPDTKGTVTNPLLKFRNSKVVMDNVIIDGSGKAGSIGLLAQNATQAGTTLTRCTFRDLDSGIVVIGSTPKISRSIFENIGGDAIYVGPVAGAVVLPVLGDASDPTTGFNFFGNVGGFFINNQSGIGLRAELNDFNGFPLDQLAGFLNGPVDADPNTVVYSLQSSMLVTVLDEESNLPIYDAEVNVDPVVMPSMMGNVDGVYPFILVPPGNYTVEVSAPGHYSVEEDVVIPINTPITAVTVYLPADGAEQKIIPLKHNSDSDQDDKIGLSELLRITQLFNAPAHRCLAGTEDGYAPGYGDTASCDPHVADYDNQDWHINLSELLRVIQLFALGSYHACESGEDGYCPGDA